MPRLRRVDGTSPRLLRMSAEDRAREMAFEEFYQLYPRSGRKRRAREAYRHPYIVAGAATILARLAIVCPAWEERVARFIPYAATWLYGEEWEG